MNKIRVAGVRTVALLVLVSGIALGVATPAVARPAPADVVARLAAKPLCTRQYPTSTIPPNCTPSKKCTTTKVKKKGKWTTRKSCITLSY